MARDLYIVPQGLHMAYGNLFSNFHAVPIPDSPSSGLEIVSILFSNDASRDTWESVPGVQVIGNELSPGAIDSDVATILAAMSVTPDMTVKDIRTLVRTTIPHPLF